MSRRVVIDSQVFGREGGSLQGELPVVSLRRLHDLLTDTAGSLVYRIAGAIGLSNRPQLLVEVDGVCLYCCQRCLEPVEYPLELRSLLEFVDHDSDLTQEELEDDSRDFPSACEGAGCCRTDRGRDPSGAALRAASRRLHAARRWCRNLTKVSPFSVLAGLTGKA
jgi:hypothetical protein